MPEVVGIKFRQCGKVYDFNAEGLSLKPGDIVVVDSDMGISLGKVVAPGAHNPEKEYKKVLRIASDEDKKEEQANAAICQEALVFCKERIAARGLEMKLIRTESTLDRKRLVFYFVSDKRIDFRELVKDMAQKFRTRIEMRQVGVRDEAKMTGGLGLCGRKLCCSEFLVDFAPISIKMAKKQELILNTGKLSGVCGRLMCCLGFEYGNDRCCRKGTSPEGAGAGDTAAEEVIAEEAGAEEAIAEETRPENAIAQEPARQASPGLPAKEISEKTARDDRAEKNRENRPPRRWSREGRRGKRREQGQFPPGQSARPEGGHPGGKPAQRPEQKTSPEEKPADAAGQHIRTGQPDTHEGNDPSKQPGGQKRKRWHKRGRRNRNNQSGPGANPGGNQPRGDDGGKGQG